MACSSVVSRGCQVCPHSPDTSKYFSYAGGRRVGAPDEDEDTVYDVTLMQDGGEDGDEWYPWMMEPISPMINPVTPTHSPPFELVIDTTSEAMDTSGEQVLDLKPKSHASPESAPK